MVWTSSVQKNSTESRLETFPLRHCLFVFLEDSTQVLIYNENLSEENLRNFYPSTLVLHTSIRDFCLNINRKIMGREFESFTNQRREIVFGDNHQTHKKSLLYILFYRSPNTFGCFDINLPSTQGNLSKYTFEQKIFLLVCYSVWQEQEQNFICINIWTLTEDYSLCTSVNSVLRNVTIPWLTYFEQILEHMERLYLW